MFSPFSRLFLLSWMFSLTFTRLQCCGLKLQGGRKIKGRMHFIICGKTFGVHCCPMQEGSSSEFLGNLRKSLRAPFLRILLAHCNSVQQRTLQEQLTATLRKLKNTTDWRHGTYFYPTPLQLLLNPHPSDPQTHLCRNCLSRSWW